MDKKGYTLIELLSSITIITLIATIASINIIKIFDDKEASARESEENIITSAACVYIELNKNEQLKNTCLTNGCDIDTDTLIKEGLLKEGDVSNKRVIHISREKNEKKCVIK